MELNPGYALITTDEYKDLIETSIYYEEILLENKELEKQVEELRNRNEAQAKWLKTKTLEDNVNLYDLKNGQLEKVINPRSHWFPFDSEFISKAEIPMEEIIEFIKEKREQFDKEKEENHE